jgi:O-methyltransferase
MSISDFLLRNPAFSGIRLAALNVTSRLLAARGLGIVSLGSEPERAPAYELIGRIRQQVQMVLLESEAYSIYSAVRETEKIGGAIAELGTFRGGSAWLICEMKGNRPLHLFDTFEGLPDVGEYDSSFRKGSFSSSLEDVKRVLKDFPDVSFHKGLFPASTERFSEDVRFSFVHLDVDLYQSTFDGLKWFYPRMLRGAILISHDFVDAEGVRRAFSEFFTDKPECLIELTGSQVAFVKL